MLNVQNLAHSFLLLNVHREKLSFWRKNQRNHQKSQYYSYCCCRTHISFFPRAFSLMFSFMKFFVKFSCFSFQIRNSNDDEIDMFFTKPKLIHWAEIIIRGILEKMSKNCNSTRFYSAEKEIDWLNVQFLNGFLCSSSSSIGCRFHHIATSSIQLKISVCSSHTHTHTHICTLHWNSNFTVVW